MRSRLAASAVTVLLALLLLLPIAASAAVEYEVRLVCPVTGQVYGWVRDTDAPGVPFTVEVFADGVSVLTTIANRMFSVPPGGTGGWFNARVPDSLRDGKWRTIEIRARIPTPVPIGAAPVLWSRMYTFYGTAEYTPAPPPIANDGGTSGVVKPSPVKKPKLVHSGKK